ncbi:MAG: hypothetical protein PF541_06650 [Prolixibacteraceae bacterium]|jgi:hypothetical protein|nr:hypothetical protein [Prolixibacteraceae bacterium]
MKKIAILILCIVSIQNIVLAQNSATEGKPNETFTIAFESGLMLGHSESYYPAYFSSNISFLKNFNDRIWIGGGTGAEVIGKTFIPFYADLRVSPFESKPFFIYNKIGWTICANKNYTDGNEDNYYYGNMPHALNENINTSGGFMNEMGVGILLKNATYKTSISIGYRHQKTNDKVGDKNPKTYENSFNRLAIRVGFWF